MNSRTKRGAKLTNKQRVLKKRPCAGVQLSAMNGWQIADYDKQYSPEIIARSSRSEADAWRNAVRVLRNREFR